MNVKLKEKEQEAKLSELKVRELKKSLPNNRLKPMKARDSMQSNIQINEGEVASIQKRGQGNRNYMAVHKPYQDDYLHQSRENYDY